MPMPFSSAVELWQEGYYAEHMDDLELRRFEIAERRILKQKPKSLSEAVDIASVLIEQSGERSDGLDKSSLMAIRDFMLSMHGGVTLRDRAEQRYVMGRA